MPIFAYRCDSCGFEKDVLQKRSDTPLVTCPECKQDTFAKRLTAPAFQLKGSGWYVTDFRDKGSTSSGKESDSSSTGASPGASSKASTDSATADAGAASTAPSTGAAASSGTSSASPASTPSTGGGTGASAS